MSGPIVRMVDRAAAHGLGLTVRSGQADNVSVGRVTCDRAEQGSAIDGIGRT